MRLSVPRLAVAIVVALLMAGGATLILAKDEPGASETPPFPSSTPTGGARERREPRRVQLSNDPIERGCALDPKHLVRIWRGHDDLRSEDVTIVPRAPNYWGSFDRWSHTGPWDYIQTVPLVLYGPGRIAAAGRVHEPVNVTGVYPTIGRLLGVRLPDRRDAPLGAALAPAPGAPELVLVIVWDGGGRNVLELWPGRWPHLRRLEAQGTSYVAATVGSSPSITTSTHANLGTGAYPRVHKVTGIDIRRADGTVGRAFELGDPREIALTTFADEADRALGNDARVGALGWSVQGLPPSGPEAPQSNHLGMLGRGTAVPGGDADELALIGDTGAITANTNFYSLPSYLAGYPGSRLQAAADELDREDGRADGRWRGIDILAKHNNPAWVPYQTEILLDMLRRGRYGGGGAPDIFLTNYKMTDIAGHDFAADSVEMADTLEAQDAALSRIIDYLDEEVGDYVVVVTADHGHTAAATTTGAWPIEPSEFTRDLDSNFGVPRGSSLVEKSSAVGLFLDFEVAREVGATPQDIARFLNSYTIGDNWPKAALPDGYEGRGDQKVFSAAFASSQLSRIMKCAFGSPRPPPDLAA